MDPCVGPSVYHKVTAMDTTPIFDKLDELIRKSGVTKPEGNCVQAHLSFTRDARLEAKRANLAAIAGKCSRLMEIGFNAGHSAAVFLAANPDLQIVSFDINEHPYTDPCARYLQEVFGSRLRVVYGDSRTAVPSFDHGGLYDAVHVDGGHAIDVVRADVANSLRVLRPGGILIMDDIFLPGIHALATELIRKGIAVDDTSSYARTTMYEHMILVVK